MTVIVLNQKHNHGFTHKLECIKTFDNILTPKVKLQALFMENYQHLCIYMFTPSFYGHFPGKSLGIQWKNCF